MFAKLDYHTEHLGWINKLLTTAIVSAPSTLTIDPRIHITGPKAQLPYIDTLEYSYAEPPSPSSASSEDKKIETIMYTALKSKRGRPDIHRVIQDSAALSEGPVSVDGEILVSCSVLHLLTMLQSLVHRLWPPLFALL